MISGIYFGNTHSSDLGLVLTLADIKPAQPKLNIIEIPGGDGSIDLTDAVGETRYADREAVFVLGVVDGHIRFEETKRRLSNLINGRRLEIRLDRDPSWKWVGRCSVGEYDNELMQTITVSATISPYKLRTRLTSVTVPAGNSTVDLENDRMTAIPTFVCTQQAVVTCGDMVCTVPAGSTRVPALALPQGVTRMSINCPTEVTITYQEGSL